MTLTTILILDAVLDAALVAILAFVMSRAAKLTPHALSVDHAPQQAAVSASRARQGAALRLRPLLG